MRTDSTRDKTKRHKSGVHHEDAVVAGKEAGPLEQHNETKLCSNKKSADMSDGEVFVCSDARKKKVPDAMRVKKARDCGPNGHTSMDSLSQLFSQPTQPAPYTCPGDTKKVRPKFGMAKTSVVEVGDSEEEGDEHEEDEDDESDENDEERDLGHDSKADESEVEDKHKHNNRKTNKLDASTPKTEKKDSKKDIKKILSPDDPERLGRTLFVSNVSTEAVKGAGLRKFRRLFSAFGRIESVRFRSISFSNKIPRRFAFRLNKFHDNCKAINAYVVMDNIESAKRALSLNATVFLDRHVRVDISNSHMKFNAHDSIFVGNLPLDVLDEDIWAFFADCGQVSAVRTVRDKATNVGKGIAYVQFGDAAAVDMAVRLDGTVLSNRPVRVQRCSSFKDGKEDGKHGKNQKEKQRHAVKETNTPDASSGVVHGKRLPDGRKNRYRYRVDHNTHLDEGKSGHETRKKTESCKEGDGKPHEKSLRHDSFKPSQKISKVSKALPMKAKKAKDHKKRKQNKTK